MLLVPRCTCGQCVGRLLHWPDCAAYVGSERARRKLFEEGLAGNITAALAATAKAPVHALTNGVHAAAASIASVAALPFANGESANSARSSRALAETIWQHSPARSIANVIV
jgi:hypothetical protein